MVEPAMNIKTAKYQIVTPALKSVGLCSASAINLVTGIGAVESGYRTLHQVNGPALGYWQMEPATHDDCWTNFLDYLPFLSGLVARIASPDKPSSALLTENMRYAAAMCRIRLYRAPTRLPVATSATALCQYWKQNYNSVLGAGQVKPETVSLFQQAIDA